MYAEHPPRKQRSLLERGGEDLDPDKSKRTAKIGESGGRTTLPGAVPAKNNDGPPWGAETNPRRSQRSGWRWGTRGATKKRTPKSGSTSKLSPCALEATSTLFQSS